jgi:multidrug efflux system membrane fusion protein
MLIVAGAGAGIAGCKPPPQQIKERSPAPVTVAVAQAQDVPHYIDEIGRTVASEVVNIQPQIGGQIMERHFADGAVLKAGDPLFSIDPRTYQAAVQQAEANLEQSEAQVELARAEFARYETAYKVKAASRDDYDTKKAALLTATAQVKVNQAALDTAKLNLSFCKINSPINGRAGQRLVDVGNIVRQNETSLLMIHRITPIYADFTITERDLPQVRARMSEGDLTALVRVPESDRMGMPAKLTFLDTTVQANAGRVQVRATLPNEDRHFWPGQFVNVRLVLETQKDAVLVPYACTQMGQQGPYVYVVGADNNARQQPVRLGQRQGAGGDMIVVLEGVKAGERVVLSGQLSVTPGEPVNVLETKVPETAPGTAPAKESPEPASAPAKNGGRGAA